MKPSVAFIPQPIDTIVQPGQHVPGSSLGVWTYEVARRLRHDFNVTIYARQDGLSKSVLESVGIAPVGVTTALDDRLTPWIKLPERLLGFPRPQRPVFASRWYYPGYIKKIARLLAANPPDIVHVFNFTQFLPVIRSACPRAKIVLHMHCQWLYELDPVLIGARLQDADLILSVSEFITERTRNHFPEIASCCHTLYNGVDSSFFAPQDGASHVPNAAAPNLLYVGRVSPEKGVHVLLKAFHEIHRAYPEARLTLVGTRGALSYEFMVMNTIDPQTRALAQFYRGRLKRAGTLGGYLQHIDDLLEGIHDRISFTGHLPQDEVRGHYHQADVLVLPSVGHEAFGMPLIEAMACGLPVVATRSGGMSEIVVEGQTGLLVKRNDSFRLADAILHVLANPHQGQAMGRAGRHRVLGYFDWEVITRQLIDWYARILWTT